MSETVVIALISGCSGALVTCIFQTFNKCLDTQNSNKEREYKEVMQYKAKKEEVYIAAIDRLLQIRRWFDYTCDDYMKDENIRKRVDEENIAFISIAPKLRLYSSDKIFREYQKLARWSKFSFPGNNGEKLFEDSKWVFDYRIILLVHMMQAELGYRKNMEEVDSVNCPECYTKHDIVEKCPKCGMTFEELQEKAEQIYQQAQEIRNNSEDETTKDN